MKEFGENLKLFRERRNLSRKEMANMLGVSLPTLGQYERGGREPDLLKLRAIARLLHVSIDDLLGYDSYVAVTQSEEAEYMQRLSDYGLTVHGVNLPNKPDCVYIKFRCEDAVEREVTVSMSTFLTAMRQSDQESRDGIKEHVEERFRQIVYTKLLLMSVQDADKLKEAFQLIADQKKQRTSNGMGVFEVKSSAVNTDK